MLKRRTRNRLRRLFRESWVKYGPMLMALLMATLQWLIWVYPIDETSPDLPTTADWIEPKLVDTWFKIRDYQPQPAHVVVVAMDDISTDKLKLSTLQPWPRELHAQLLNKLAAYGSRMAIFDLIFQEKREAEGDQAFVDAMGKIDTVVGKFEKRSYLDDGSGEPEMITFTPLEMIGKSAKQIIHMGCPADNDLVMRRFDTVDGSTPGTVPMADALFGQASPPHGMPGFRDLINIYGPPGRSVKIVPYYRALNDPSLEPIFKDAVVLVGEMIFVGTATANTQAAGSYADSHRVPISSQMMFGVEIQANIAGNLLQGDWIRRFPNNWERSLAMTLTFLFTYILLSLRPTKGGALLAGSFLAWALISYQLFLRHLFLPGLCVWLLLLVSYIISAILHYTRTRRVVDDLETAAGVKLQTTDGL